MANVIVGLYNDLQQAFEVISQLQQAKFSTNDISILTNETHGSKQSGMTDQMRGVFSDLKRHELRGVGKIYARGPLAGHLSGDTRLVDAFSDMGAQANDAEAYLEALRRGNTLVAVNADPARSDEAVQIMSQLNPLPTDRMAEQWRQSGWKGYDENAQPYTSQDMDREGQQVLPIIQEEVRVGKREVQRGGLRVHTRVEENPVEKPVQLREEHVNVERRPADRPASDADLQAFQEGTIEVRTTAEEPMVDKQARVVEEVVVDKNVQHREEVIRDTERRTAVDVEHLDGSAGGVNLNANDTDFRRHYDQDFSRSNVPYERIQPAYQYGYTTAGQYKGRQWNDVESNLRRDWERQHPDTKWDQVKAAIREGFDRATR